MKGREPSVRQAQATAPARNTPSSRRASEAGNTAKNLDSRNFGPSGADGVEPQRRQEAVISEKDRRPRPRGTPPRAGSRKGWRTKGAGKRHYFGFSGERGVEPQRRQEAVISGKDRLSRLW